MFGGLGLCSAEPDEGPSKLKRSFDQVTGHDTDADESLKNKFAKTAIPLPEEAMENTASSKSTTQAKHRIPPMYVDLEKDIEPMLDTGDLVGAISFKVYDVLRQVSSIHFLRLVLIRPSSSS